jgi:fatty acid synthase, animal type
MFKTLSFNGLVDTACSSSMYALNMAYKDIKNGIIDAAIVVGSNMILNPFMAMDLTRFL